MRAPGGIPKMDGMSGGNFGNTGARFVGTLALCATPPPPAVNVGSTWYGAPAGEKCVAADIILDSPRMSNEGLRGLSVAQFLGWARSTDVVTNTG